MAVPVCYKNGWYVTVTLSRVPNQDRTVMASWRCNWYNVASYDVFWRYGLQNGKYIDSNQSVTHIPDNENYQNTFQYPENATWVQVWVRPRESTDGETWGYMCPWSPKSNNAWFYVYDYQKPKDIPTPSLEADPNNKIKLTTTATIDSIEYDPNTTHVQFYVVDGKGNIIHRPYVAINRKTSLAVYRFNGTYGNKYKISARGYNQPAKMYGEWSSYSEEVYTPPKKISIKTLKSVSTTSVSISWTSDGSGYTTSHDVAYTTNPKLFTAAGGDDSAGTIKSFTGSTQGIIDGLETGNTWYFRVRAVNSAGGGTWSDVKSISLGVRPSPPTTWSSTVTAMRGETVSLNWTHNSRDGSSMRQSQIELTYNGNKKIITVEGKKDSDTDEWLNSGKHSLNIDSLAPNISSIQWRVRTKGVLDSYSDYSVTREIKVYSPATLTVLPYKTDTPSTKPLDILESFPFYVIASSGPSSQKAIGFHISIVADESYQKQDPTGETVWVNSGEEIYSKYFDFDATSGTVKFDDYAVIKNNVLTLKLMPQDMDLVPGYYHTIKGVVSMDSGLTAEAESRIIAEWGSSILYPQADVEVNTDDFTSVIVPYCPEIPDTPNGMSDLTNPNIPKLDLPLVDNVLLSVYRIGYDGRYTKIMDQIENNRSVGVVDPHPSIDYARYRIVATDQSTGYVGYTDIEPVKIGQPGIVIQWDEFYLETTFVNPADKRIESTPNYIGTILTLPYNVNTSEGNSPDRSAVEYVGQSHPVSYFGTQLGTKATWSSVIEKTDTDRLDLLRRLSAYQGNVYVRNSRGVGYWAIVDVSYNINYGDSGENMLIPVTLNITRVEGDV